ncbi:hypothetical protein [Thermoflavimicrobium daqui]|jgi:hypothetical protein|uniref:Uncharacterized protein n=1 Tax=Thermoflavimicrobium daqui TaxID=2137476 RepID=A0A364K541_9BACL|nr:hypothetical protein [Thermoflavimicrobium daqui]RAL24466.1 hypothetical protein DL897_09105 [Thermoflavimicrobium daqui]
MTSINVKVTGSGHDVVQFALILSEYFDIDFRDVVQQPSTGNEKKIDLEFKTSVEQPKQTAYSLANKMFYILAFEFFNTPEGQSLQDEFQESIKTRSQSACKKVRLKALEVIHQRMMLNFEWLMRQKKLSITTDSLDHPQKIGVL